MTQRLIAAIPPNSGDSRLILEGHCKGAPYQQQQA